MSVASDHRPTDLELDILHIIWREKKVTVRQVVDGLPAERDLALTTVTTLMNRMVVKGWLKRFKQGPGRYVYTPLLSQAKTQRKMLKNFIHKLFRGSAPALIQNAIDAADMDSEELQQISDLIEQAKQEKK